MTPQTAPAELVIEVHPGRDCDDCQGIPRHTVTTHYLCLRHLQA